MHAAELLIWYNLLFVISIVTAFLILLITAVTGIGHEMGGAEADLDADVGMDADTDAGIDADADAGADHSFLHETGAHDHDGSLLKALTLFGVGKVPISVIVTLVLFLFGMLGLSSNLVFEKMGLPPVAYFWFSLSAAAILSLILTGRLANLVARFMPSLETTKITPYDLVGRAGTAEYTISTNGGRVIVRDSHLNLHVVDARTIEGQIQSGEEIVVVEYEKEESRYVVSKLDL
ncbi:TPA: DUF1449 domain-containing protein [Candidatus Berkelbacteria bacterium]|uniref:Inner membrane protein YqiJ N-terminal domain-containing protein n=1 Tax=Berkelbacteria bacterium GW2011_GWE1_39_12 TaxID=1618337 RepID=A0A0G4B4I4_9BACT|nr:MAG: hypothetical protein UT28_C0001G0102 [Berkelbacteria bacterium GW2011_GWE1_39_12]HBO60489.1 DUF1449 domain-containing protein [Candidatus Berkelbacteria bacterium]